ncbi:MAG: hypothetical protein HYV28_07835 [Ignavibacteriales bacterium]|nr:hypothetical protein [Ignavibacteriales bacterium]
MNFDNMPLNQLKHAAKIMYEATETDAMETKKQQGLLFANGKIGKNALYPFRCPLQVYDHLLNRHTAQLHTALPVISCDCLFKATVKSVKKVKYISPSDPDGFPFSEIDVAIVIDEIYKGSTSFKVGDEITFYYMLEWMETANLTFAVGETLLLPLIIKGNNYNVHGLIFNPESYGKFPIVNNKVIDPLNYFGYGTEVPWEEFRSKIIQQINEIKSW